MKKGILYTTALLVLIAFSMGGCKKDFTGTKKLIDTSVHLRVSTLATGLYNYITADNNGNVYALRFNYGADTIYKIDSTGNRTFFYTPPVAMDHDTTITNTMVCLTTDTLGNVYTVNYSAGQTPSVLKITPAGSGGTVFSNISSNTGITIQKIAVNHGNFYFSDYTGIHKITPGGSSSLVVNTGISVFAVNGDGILFYLIPNGGNFNLGEIGNAGQYTFPGITLSNVVDITTNGWRLFISQFDNGSGYSSISTLNLGSSTPATTTIVSSPLGHLDGPVATAKIGVAFSLSYSKTNKLYFTEITGIPADIRKISL